MICLQGQHPGQIWCYLGCMYSSAGLGTEGDVRRSPEGSELGGDIEKYKKNVLSDFC